jgi:hypothetical protein
MNVRMGAGLRCCVTLKKSVLPPAFFCGMLYEHVTDECLFARVTLLADVAELADAPDLGSGIS